MGERLVGGLTSLVIGRDCLSGLFTGEEPLLAVLTQAGEASATARAVIEAADAAGLRTSLKELPDGDAAKSLAVVEETAAWLAEVGMTRRGVIVGVGGGALTDAAGFVASVYMRGVPVRYVPTTLLAAVDAAIGGKTAVNVGGKNLIGTFAHPEKVVIDLEVLESLAEPLLADGMAEALKAGLVGDPDLFAILERSGLGAELEEVIERAIDVKAKIVDADFRESGIRAYLNYGHTVGHALERLAGLSHGRAVAVGMVAAGIASQIVTGFPDAERVQRVIESLGLPVSCQGVGRDDALRLVEMDKKRDPDGLRMVLLERIGRPVVSSVPAATLDAALEAIGIGGR